MDTFSSTPEGISFCKAYLAKMARPPSAKLQDITHPEADIQWATPTDKTLSALASATNSLMMMPWAATLALMSLPGIAASAASTQARKIMGAPEPTAQEQSAAMAMLLSPMRNLSNLAHTLHEHHRSHIMGAGRRRREGSVDLASPCSWAGLAQGQATAADAELLIATRCKSIGMVHAALAKGANPNAIEPDGYTALCVACLNGRDQIALALLGAGADPNQASIDGATPLMLSGTLGGLELPAHLIRAGAKVDAASSGATLADFASSHPGWTDSVATIAKAMEKSPSRFKTSHPPSEPRNPVSPQHPSLPQRGRLNRSKRHIELGSKTIF